MICKNRHSMVKYLCHTSQAFFNYLPIVRLLRKAVMCDNNTGNVIGGLLVKEL